MTEAYRQLFMKGISSTKIEDIAQALKMSKKTIYLLFRSKEEIIMSAGMWKLSSIASKAQLVVESNPPIVNKLIGYIECIYVNTEDVSLAIIEDFLFKRKKVEGIVNDYLKSAVFERFKQLFEQAKTEKRLKENSDLNSSLVLYWGMLSTFLFAKSHKSLPNQLDEKLPINQMICHQLINLFRGLLNDIGIKEFDYQLKSHPVLISVFA